MIISLVSLSHLCPEPQAQWTRWRIPGESWCCPLLFVSHFVLNQGMLQTCLLMCFTPGSRSGSHLEEQLKRRWQDRFSRFWSGPGSTGWMTNVRLCERMSSTMNVWWSHSLIFQGYSLASPPLSGTSGGEQMTIWNSGPGSGYLQGSEVFPLRSEITDGGKEPSEESHVGVSSQMSMKHDKLAGVTLVLTHEAWIRTQNSLTFSITNCTTIERHSHASGAATFIQNMSSGESGGDEHTPDLIWDALRMFVCHFTVAVWCKDAKMPVSVVTTPGHDHVPALDCLPCWAGQLPV